MIRTIRRTCLCNPSSEPHDIIAARAFLTGVNLRYQFMRSHTNYGRGATRQCQVA